MIVYFSKLTCSTSVEAHSFSTTGKWPHESNPLPDLAFAIPLLCTLLTILLAFGHHLSSWVQKYRHLKKKRKHFSKDFSCTWPIPKQVSSSIWWRAVGLHICIFVTWNSSLFQLPQGTVTAIQYACSKRIKSSSTCHKFCKRDPDSELVIVHGQQRNYHAITLVRPLVQIPIRLIN
jgi:hypothetical protein